jgi:hypothetical protein
MVLWIFFLRRPSSPPHKKVTRAPQLLVERRKLARVTGFVARAPVPNANISVAAPHHSRSPKTKKKPRETKNQSLLLTHTKLPPPHTTRHTHCSRDGFKETAKLGGDQATVGGCTRSRIQLTYGLKAPGFSTTTLER